MDTAWNWYEVPVTGPLARKAGATRMYAFAETKERAWIAAAVIFGLHMGLVTPGGRL
jgi:glycerate kinase